MTRTPRGMRLHIGIFGRRNTGKSSLLNALVRQSVSLVSGIAGTTTDPVEKPMELLPVGPVLFIDTAGLDDEGYLGGLRIERTRRVFQRTDLGLLVTDCGIWGPFEEELRQELQIRQIPFLVVFNKADLDPPSPAVLEKLAAAGIPAVRLSAIQGEGMAQLREQILRLAPDEFINAPSIMAGLVPPGELAVLVVPIDKEAPKGRLILPQVQVIRDLLDHDSCCMVVKERELRDALARLNRPPVLVVTDSQAFQQVAADTPPGIPLTSFSILFARYRGDLLEFVRGAKAIGRLQAGARILVAEACTHHPIGDDIGRVKLPLWLNRFTGGKLEFVHVQGHDFPAGLAEYQLVIHCGACMLNRREVLNRVLACREAGVPVTNYGLAIAYSLGIFSRALSPFPEAARLAAE